MKCSKKLLFDAEEVAKRWPEFRGEKKASIGHNWIWKTVLANYHIYDDFRKSQYIKGDLD